MIRESCVLCAVKHIAQARVLLFESKKGYAEHYHFALGHLAEAEDELIKDHEDLVIALREPRKELEENPDYEYPFAKMILFVAEEGSEAVERRVREMESDLDGRTLAELRECWTEIQA